METQEEQRHLVKFLVVSVTSFFIGSIHGVLQMIPSIRAWLDSIGSPYGGPGHMIDPLAHAHINLIGGVMVLAMATTYYLLPKMTGTVVWSKRLVEHSFWWTVLGVTSFYSVLMIFGVWEGVLLLQDSPEMDAVHKIYVPLASISASVMGFGMWLFLTNVAMTIRSMPKKP